MHAHRITGQQLALESGYSSVYVSMVLCGHKGTEQTKARLLEALSRLEQKAEEKAEETDA